MTAQKFSRLAAMFLAACVITFPYLASANDSLIVGFPSLSMSSIMPNIAQELGYFAAEGLDVDIQHFESGSTNAKALLAHAVDLSDVETSAILTAAAGGADLRIIGTHEWGLHFILYAVQEIKSLKDLEGKRFAISGMGGRIGGLPHVVIVALMRDQNLDPDRLQLLPIGGQGARLKALIAGKVDATVGEESEAIASDPKFHAMFVVADRLPQYLSQGMAVNADTLKTKGPAIEKFQRAMLKAARYAYADKAGFVKLVAKYVPLSLDELGRVYDFYYRVRHWSINGDVPVERIEYMQELGLASKNQAKPVDIKHLIDTQSIDRILAKVGRVDFP
jgi:ABC-type nitrate/sulfonate/bicarbonate transport system substrate-binding protein